jgi:hypothetical protein
MTETELLFQISTLVNGHMSFRQAVEQAGLLLKREANCKSLIIEYSGEPAPTVDILRLFDTFDQAYRSLYVVDLRPGGEILGKATFCFASDDFHGELPKRLSDFVGEQLGMMLARTRLAERRARLKNEIEQIEKDLAVRKVMQRAEGILVAKRGMTLAAAKRWITKQSERTGLSQPDIADRIVAYHLATGLLEQRIA